LEEARKERERLTAEMRQAHEAKTREHDETKASLLRQQQEEVGRLQEERRLLSEAAEKLQEERDRLNRERESVELEKQAAAESQARAQELVEREKQAAAATRAHAMELLQQAKQTKPEPEPIREPTRPATTFRREVADQVAAEPEDHANRTIARAEDVLAHLAAPRARERKKVEDDYSPPPAVAPRPPRVPQPDYVDEMSDDSDELTESEDYSEEYGEEEEAETETRGEVVPKGGLVYRGLAVSIDLLLLLLVLGLFLVIGRLVSGSKGGDPTEVVRMLGLPFYILFLLLAATYFTYLHGSSGQTLGKRLLRLQVFTTHGEPIGYLTAFFRFVAACFAVAFLGMGIFWIALDPNKQGWHDKISRTVVIRL
jgi:uncharacterized RDD family membrane protein YckC